MAASSSTRAESARMSEVAPCIAAPAPLRAASSSRPRSRRSGASAARSAAPCFLTASSTKARSARRAAEASRIAVPWYFTASSTTSLSALSSGEPYLRACPSLAMTAASMRSLSAHTSFGASESLFQSSSTAARQFACRQLLLSTVKTPACWRSAGVIWFLSAAAETPARTTAKTPTSPPSSPVRARSSLAERSLDRLNSFRSLSADLSFVMTAALAPVRKKRPGMSRTLAASVSSNSVFLSTLTKFASHFVAPHSARLSLSRGVRSSPVGVSLWCFRYSHTLSMIGFFRGNVIGSAIPLRRAIFRTLAEMVAASAGSSKLSPSFDFSVIVAPRSSSGHVSNGENRR
mmetsp:Transcript_46781/g.138219  ORF Transcript_46781/g.138219 Transcript_46781/m.138219 type:complete len:347 (+) Transcript_46781:1685-2725(+)